MAYLPSGMPVPQPTADDNPFWEGCRERRLIFRHCNICNQPFHPPMPSCPRCGGTQVAWKEIEGRGNVFSYTIVSHPAHPALKNHPPYNVIVVLFEGTKDLRLVSNLVDIPNDQLRTGIPVEVFWDDIGDGMYLPRFKRRAA